MRRLLPLEVWTTALLLVAGSSPGRAQNVIIDDVIILTRSEAEQERARSRGFLTPVGTASPLPPAPGADEPLLEGPTRFGPRLSLQRPRPLEHRPEPGGPPPLIAPVHPFPEPSLLPSGPLELPAVGDEGPPDGLPLDRAIDRLLEANYDLRIRFQEIPKAQADVLSAGLRNNPFLFVSADAVPYGRFSPERPGVTTYDVTVIQPIDVSGRRRNRILVAQQAKKVLEAQYQNAVREEIDRLYTAYVQVLEARQAVRVTAASVGELAARAAEVVRQGRPGSEAPEAVLRRFRAESALHNAEAALVQARRNLATLLAIPAEQADALDVRDSLHDRAPPPPGTEALVQLALKVRPDLAAYRLGVERARADVQLERSEGIEDVFLFYTPYTTQDFSPQGLQSANGWGLGVLLPIPIFNRNQGNVQRARINQAQVQMALEALERQVANEVQQARAEYEASRAVVRRFEQEGLPAARFLRDEKLRRYNERKEGPEALAAAQQEYGEMVRHYLETLVRHRRSMLRLNTVVGQRVLP